MLRVVDGQFCRSRGRESEGLTSAGTVEPARPQPHGCSAPATASFGLPSLSELLHRSECLTGALLGETQVFSRSISEHVD
jgi:hypothetical protein